RSRASVEELDEVVGEDCAAVAPACVELADDDVRRGALRGRGDEQSGGQQGDEEKRHPGARHWQLQSGEGMAGPLSDRSPSVGEIVLTRVGTDLARVRCTFGAETPLSARDARSLGWHMTQKIAT